MFLAQFLNKILKSLSFSLIRMKTSNKSVLKRIDDHGNEFKIGEYEQMQQAEEKLKELTQYGHKQHYWIELQSEAIIMNPQKDLFKPKESPLTNHHHTHPTKIH